MKMPFETGFVIASPFGWRTDPITGEGHVWHGGVDLVGNDRNVRAACSGYVLRSRMAENKGDGDRTWEWGNYVSVMGDDGKVIYYCHLLARHVAESQRVEAGQILGIEGSTGRSTGIHLHFEVRDVSGNQLDPCAYLGIPNRAGYEYDPPEPWEEQCHDWSRDAVEWAISRGILKGDGKGNYRLGEPVTREEMLVFLYRAREVL
jgi:murein DD-endopeptidase MepM/ murein hydrolase activator NlpD